MCTILDAAINKGISQGIEQGISQGISQGIERGITQGETLKLIVQVQKKIKKGDSISKIADDLVEDEITIIPIYETVKEYPNDTEQDIYRRLNK